MKKPVACPNIHRENPPEWFKGSDLGIFIHWGAATIPAYAPTDVEDYNTLTMSHPPEYMFINIPYTEWYQNSIALEDSPAQRYHREHYPGRSYTSFADEFKRTARDVDVEYWADLFARTGAKYVVAVTKHHDGFVLFDTHIEHPRLPGYHLDFDYVGDLARACRRRGLRFGVYYSSLLDWTFTDKPIRRISDLFLGNDQSKLYRDYCYNHWIELIDRYQPDILWSDIGYPADPRLEALFAYFYRQMPEGVVNDRWGQFPNWLRNPLGKKIVDQAAAKILREHPGELLDTKYYDFRTIEYTSRWQENGLWFEMCRGMDKSFGYNQFSRPEDYITAAQVMDILADIVPKKGRLLLNVGPDSHGAIPPYQQAILRELEELRHG